MTTDGKKLVVFFSHTGENYNVGYIEKGNTHIIADMIADATGADRFEVVPEKGYPKDTYQRCIEIAKRELQQNARPAVIGDIAIEDYDVIFIDYPQWWGFRCVSIPLLKSMIGQARQLFRSSHTKAAA